MRALDYTSADNQFYPTPKNLAERLASMVDWSHVTSVLEPNAGKGDLLRYAVAPNARRFMLNRIDMVEKDIGLRALLNDEGMRASWNFENANDIAMNLVDYDIFSLGNASEDLVIMNPPFKTGADHLLHILKIRGAGTQVACILNAETLRNTGCDRKRQELGKRLAEAGAVVEYVIDAFSDAERKASVDVALIYVPASSCYDEDLISGIFKEKAEEEMSPLFDEEKDIAPTDPIDVLVARYKAERDAGLRIIRAFAAAGKRIPNADGTPLISLDVKKFPETRDKLNSYVKNLRLIYWKAIFESNAFTEKLTSNILDRYREQVYALAEYEFSRENIEALNLRMMSEALDGVKDAIEDLFDRFTRYSNYNGSGNIHYYNGWDSNKAHKIADKVVYPAYLYDEFLEKFNEWKASELISDIEKVFDFVSTSGKGHQQARDIVARALREGVTKNIHTVYFDLTFYKKGTMHIKFTDKDALDRLNIYVAKNRGWLPPSYGKKKYENMDQNEKDVVDSFQGKDKYEHHRMLGMPVLTSGLIAG